MAKHYYIVLLFLLLRTVGLAQFDAMIIDSLGQVTLDKTATNGAYISIMQNKQVVYSKAFGYNDTTTQTILTDSTLFPISSNTKAFNSILLSQLAEDKLLDFEEPLFYYLPEINLSSEFMENELNLIDLLTHRWGIPRYDFTYYVLDSVEKKAPNRAVFNKLKYLETTSSSRTKFSYGNNQYIVAAYLLEQLTKQKWEQRLLEKILTPLGMDDTHCDLELYKKTASRSIGYQQKKAVNMDMVAPMYDVSGMGNMFSSIRDLQQWSRFLLEGDTNILSKDWIDFNLQGHFVVGFEESEPGFSNLEYGLGWYVYDYYGSKVVLHHGDNIGHQTLLVILPDDDIAFQLMANEGMVSNSFCFRMAFSLLDMLKLDNINDWNEIRATDYVYESEFSDLPNKVLPTVDLTEYTGVYQHEGFGTIKVSLKNGALYVESGAFKDTLTHFNEDMFVFNAVEFQEAYTFRFKVTEKEVIGLETSMVELSIDPVLFEKQ